MFYLVINTEINPEMGLLRLEYFTYPQFITTNLHVQCCRMQLPLTVIYFTLTFNYYFLNFIFMNSELTQIVTDVTADPTLPRTDQHECPKYVIAVMKIR